MLLLLQLLGFILSLRSVRCSREISFNGNGYLAVEHELELNSIDIGFEFLTGNADTTILDLQSMDSTGNHIRISLRDGQIRIEISKDRISHMAHLSGSFNDGKWHSVNIKERYNNVTMFVDDVLSSSIFLMLQKSIRKFSLNRIMIADKILKFHYRYRGCIRNLMVHNTDVIYLVNSSMVRFDMAEMNWKCLKESFTNNWKVPFTLQSSQSAITFSIEKHLKSTFLLQFDFKWTGSNFSLFQLAYDQQYILFDLLSFYICIKTSISSDRKFVPFSSYGQWNTINIAISRLQVNISMNSQLIFNTTVDLQEVSKFSFTIGTVNVDRKSGKRSVISDSLMVCIRNVFINYRPYAMINAIFADGVVTGCSQIFGCAFSPCPIKSRCSYSYTQSVVCHCSTNRCVPNLQVIDSKFLSFTIPEQTIVQHMNITAKPKLMHLYNNFTDFLSIYNLSSLIITRLPLYPKIDLLTFQNNSQSSFAPINRFTIDDVIKKNIFCCKLYSKPLSKSFSISFVIYFNISKGSSLNFIPNQAIINGIYLEMKIKYFNETMRPLLKLPTGRIIMFDSPSILIDDKIILSDRQVNPDLVFSSFPTERFCGEFIFRFNASMETIIDTIPLKIKYEFIHSKQIYFRTSKQCDFKIWAFKDDKISKRFILSIIPKLSLSINIRNTGISCSLFSKTFILPSHLSIQIPNVRASEIIFQLMNTSIKEENDNIEVYNTNARMWKKSLKFSQSDINRGFVRYISDSDNEFQPQLTYTYVDISILVHTKVVETIILLVQMTKLEVKSIRNWDLILNLKSKRFVRLSEKYLNVVFEFESYSLETLSNIWIRLKNIPLHGFISYTEIGKGIKGFSLLELRMGKVFYTVQTNINNPNLLKEILEFDVVYKSVELLKDLIFVIHIVYNEGPSDLILHKYPTLTSNGTNYYKINAENLWPSYDNCHSFIFSIVVPPKFGKFVPNIEFFSKQDIVEGILTYHQENLEAMEDRFIFNLSCKKGFSRINLLDEFWMKLEVRNHFPPEKKLMEKIYVSYGSVDILSPGLLRFDDRDSGDNLVYEIICNSNSFPPCPCNSNSGLIYHENGERRKNFTMTELENFQIQIRNRKLISENLCFRISDGNFDRISITSVNVDNLSGLVLPLNQRFILYIKENLESSIYINIQCSFYLDSSLNNFYFVLTSQPEFGNLFSSSKRQIFPNHIISLQDILQMRLVYKLKGEYRINGVEENIRFHMKNTINNELKEIRITFITEFMPTIPYIHPMEVDCVPIILNRLQVFLSHDLTNINEQYLLSKCQTIREKHQIVYNVIKPPIHGSLQYRRNSFLINDIQRFSQLDLLMGRIYYSCRICKYQQSPADDEIGKIPSDKEDEETPIDHFLFQIETPITDIMRQWRFDIGYSKVMVLLTNEGLVVQQKANQTLNDMNIKIYQHFYFHNRYIHFNISLSILHFKITSNPQRGTIYSSKLDRPIQMFPYQDIKQNEIIYLHQGNIIDNEDKFEMMAYVNHEVNRQSPIISEPIKVKVHIKDKTRQIKMTILKAIHSWTHSKVAIPMHNLHAVCDCDNNQCNNKVLSCVQNDEDLVYQVVTTSNGFVIKLSQPSVVIQNFTQQDINMNLIYFVDTGNTNIKRSGGFRFHVTLRSNREIAPIVNEKFIINFYPIILSIHKQFAFEVSSISACQCVSEKHLLTITLRPNPDLPKINVYYKLIRTPRHGTINKKVFNNKTKRINLKTIQKNGIFSQNDIKNRLICFIIFPGSDFGHFRDMAHLLVLTNTSLVRKNNFVNFEIFIRPENINQFNQNIFFQDLSWIVTKNESFLLTFDRFRLKSFVEHIFSGHIFILIQQPIYGHLIVNNVPMNTNSVFFLNDIIRGNVIYAAFVGNSIYPVTDNVEIQISPNITHLKPENGYQNIRLSFIIIATSQNFTVDLKCVKHSHQLITLSSLLLINNTQIYETCEKIYLKITNSPNNGRVVIRSNSNRLIYSDYSDLVRCSEIKNGLVYYRNINSNSDSDRIGLEVYHANLQRKLHNVLVRIKLIPLKLDISTKPVGIPQCRNATIISSNHIEIATNLLSESENFYITVDLLPLYGNIYIDHIPVSGFKYSYILQARVLYIQSDMRRSTDRFDISVSFGSENQRISNLVSVNIYVVPQIEVRTAMVMIGAKLILTSQHINSESLIQCSGSYVLFSIQNKQFKYGELSKDKSPGDNTFTNYDIQFQRLVYESFSFLPKEIDDPVPRNPQGILVDEIVLSISTPNSSIQVQPSFVTFRIQIIPKDYMKSQLKISSGNIEKQDGIETGHFVKGFFSLPILCIILFSAVLLTLLIVAIWYCIRYQNLNRKHLFYQNLSSFSNSEKKTDEPIVSKIQSIEQSVPMFTNRFFVDSGNENFLVNESNLVETKFHSPSTQTIGIEIEHINKRPVSTANTIKIWL